MNISYGSQKPRSKATQRKRVRAIYMAILGLVLFTSTTSLASSDGKNMSGDGFSDKGTLVAIEPVQVSIIQDLAIQGIFIIDFYVDAPESRAARKLEFLMPRLRDAYLRGINEFANHEIRIERPVNLDRLDLYLIRETEAIMNETGFRILFKQVMVQKR